ncbi:UNVERIFIED_CONTAM: hypothetical protein Sradi_3326200 [Sesamum radiatum]|uniref:Myb/SANT-like domain-containing protein n=1 Tax=Sesamum radiatum TaxID=300843 RepID=A0AAW2R1V8_SESRA
MNPLEEEGNNNLRHYRAKPDKTTTKRTWSQREEEALINALCTICTTGWRCENGFRAGYLNQLEALMFKKFPNTDLRAEPHINSKIHIWKKNYNTQVGMMDKSGLGWDDNRYMVTVDSQDVREEYCKVDPTAQTMRYKSWPFFPTWREIFGRDRVDGGCILEIVNEYVHPSKSQVGQTDTQECYVPTAEWCPKFGYVGNDRATSEDIQSVDARLTELSKKLFVDYIEVEKRAIVYEAVGKVPGIDLNDQIIISDKLVENPKKRDIFFSLPDEARARMVGLMLNGKV